MEARRNPLLQGELVPALLFLSLLRRKSCKNHFELVLMEEVSNHFFNALATDLVDENHLA